MDNKTTDMRLFAQKCIGDKLHETCLAVIRGSITAQNVFKFECSKQITLCIGSHKYDLTSYLNKYPPCIFLSDTSFIDGATRYYLESGEAFTIEEERLNPWDWTGVDLSVESQTIEKKTNSIQFSAIQRIKDDYDVVFDDDGAGEIADIVAIKEMPNDTLKVDFYHCKYCTKGNQPGARISDVYEVAGQAVKSTQWCRDPAKLLNHIRQRETKRIENKLPSRFEKGDLNNILSYSQAKGFFRYSYGITIIQPAISKKNVSKNQLIVLGSAYSYISDTTDVKLNVITSP